MQISSLDWMVIILFFVSTLIIGLSVVKKAGKGSIEYFLSGRNMPWWLLGISMVATTFSADTPNLVTDIVRRNGVAGNWVWWAFLLTGMLTVFVYAQLWRRSGITTDLEFYELRYSGSAAKFLRGFRAIYLGVFFNVIIMASVMLAGIKISGIVLGMNAIQTVLLVSVITVVYSSLGGLRGVLFTDFFQFILSMAGMIFAAVFIVNMPEIGGLESLISHPAVVEKRDFFPDFNNPEVYVPLFIIPLAVQWWSVWYPGAEPGGGGYIAQRMLSAKNEKNAILATLLFNVAHYALRPWPWILIALASLIVFPDLSAISNQFPGLDPSIVKDDLAFPAMLSYLPSGLLGLVIAALLAALMSTLSTHLNWGSSYLVNDFYQRFLHRGASEEQLVLTGRISTVVLMLLAAILALFLENALQAFNILLQIGAGTGLLFILRWFWWRINATSEIVAMIASFLAAFYFELIYNGSMPGHMRLLVGIGFTTAAWIIATYIGPATDRNVLINFYKLIKPASFGWKMVVKEGIEKELLYTTDVKNGKLPTQIAIMFLACTAVYNILFLIGFFLYGNIVYSIFCGIISLFSSFLIYRLWNRATEI